MYTVRTKYIYPLICFLVFYCLYLNLNLNLNLNFKITVLGLLIALRHNWAFLGVGVCVFTALTCSWHCDLRQRLKRERNPAVRNSKVAGGADKE